MAQLARDLAWEGCLNVRDLGGHPLETGGETRYGRVVRADSVRNLTRAGWQGLAEHGVRTVVDLRFHEELAADPPAELPVAVRHVSVFPEPHDPIWPEVEALVAAADDPAAGLRDLYLRLLAARRDRVAEALAAIAGAPEGAVVVHCLVGKDRTGLVVALLLRLAGVAVADVAADYAPSARNLRPVLEARLALERTEAQRELRRRMIASPAATMAGVLTALEREHGSVAGYLRAGGLSAEDLARARARLL